MHRTNRRKPTGLRPLARILTKLYRSVLITLAHARIFRVTVTGRVHVPRRGQVIIACNHISIADPVFIWGALRRNTVALAMAELWRIPGVNLVVSSIGHIPVMRSDRVSGKQALAAAKLVLNHKGALLIFPEGKCSVNGSLLPFKPGVAHLALATGAPIVPVAISGSDHVKVRGSWRIKRKAPVRVTFGPPIDPRNYAGSDATSQLLEKVRTDIDALRKEPL